MKTKIQIEGQRFLINGLPTYCGQQHNGRAIEGLMFNSRTVQAIFDDKNPSTRHNWVYPDTDKWDPERNTDEFCKSLELYKKHGLLAVTVGLQGGGSIYSPAVYDHYINSAYSPSGELDPDYLARLSKVLKSADELGMVVIVNYFYWKQALRLEGASVIRKATERTTDWLLETGYQNILIDIMNETSAWPGGLDPILQPQRVHELIEIVQGTSLNGRRIPVGVSTVGGGEALPFGKWLELEDFHMPHGNDCPPPVLAAKLQRLKNNETFKKNPKPILVNEDSICLDNMDVCIDAYASWGHYSQGFGSVYKDLHIDWRARPREKTFAELSGFQTVPVNWGINTAEKTAFFEKVATVTGHSV